MEHKEPLTSSNWGTTLINKIVHPFTVLSTPLFLLFLIVYLMYNAFASGIDSGVRSFAGVLLPLILVTFIFVFQKDLIRKLGQVPTLVSFGVSFAVGIIVMAVLHFLAQSSGIPIVEVVLSGTFSILVFSYASLQGNQMLSYFYGMISGFLFYIIGWGFPVL